MNASRCLLPVLFLCALSYADAQLTFLMRGKEVKKLDLNGLTAIAPPQNITVFEHHESQEATYRAIPVREIFNAVYGHNWKGMGEALFTCTDGYQPEVPVSQLQKFQSYFGFERAGSPNFLMINKLQGSEKILLGPFYLIWDNLKSPELRAKGAKGWPYMLASVDMVRSEERFPHMAPPARSAENVHRGFEAFRANCFACHKVNGEGGDKSFDLNQPVSVTEYFKNEWLKKWIRDPQSLRPGTSMPGFGKTGKEAEAEIDDVIAYLTAMAHAKKK